MCLCLASNRPSEREFFVLTRTDLAFKLLTAIAIGAHERQLFDKLLWRWVTSTIFVRCERLIARKLAVLFGFNSLTPIGPHMGPLKNRLA